MGGMAKRRKRSPLRETPLRYAGWSLEAAIENRALDMFYWFVLAIMGLALVALDWSFYFNPKPELPVLPTLAAAVLLGIAALRIVKGRREIDRLKMARDGEQLVAEGLEQLVREGAAVLHDIPGDGFNLDHVIVAPRGVYLVETKTYSKPTAAGATISVTDKEVFVNGRSIERNPIEQAKALARWLHELLLKSTGRSFFVRPVVLFPGWFVEPMRSGQEVWVLNPKALPTFIANEPATLSEPDVHLAAFHLSRYVRTRVK
jgi:hypothetical protein